MEYNWGAECEWAERLFARGVVDENSLFWLFHPNMPVVSRDRSEPMVSMLCDEHDFLKDASKVTAWRWTLTGEAFQRSSLELKIKTHSRGQVAIDSLDTYPLKHASQELLSILEARGRTYCQLSRPRLWSYSGWDANKDFMSVSSSRRLIARIVAEVIVR